MANTENQSNQNSNFGIPNKDFEPVKKSGSSAPLMIAFILLLLVGAGLFYMLYWRPMQEKGNDATAAETTQDEVTLDTPEGDASEEGDAVNDATPAEEEQEPETVTTKVGSVKQLTTPLNMYHVIVGSFIDEDIAQDFAEKLAKKGVEVFIIPPKKGKLFHIVSVDRAKTREEAKELQAMLSSTYKDSRIVKY